MQALLSSGPFRRFIALGVGVVAMLLNRYFKLELTEADQAMLTALVITYMAQSSWKEATVKKVEAAATAAVEAYDTKALPVPSKVDILRAQLAAEEAREAAQKGGGQS